MRSIYNNTHLAVVGGALAALPFASEAAGLAGASYDYLDATLNAGLARFGFYGGIDSSPVQSIMYHSVTSPEAAQGVLNGINPLRLNPLSRFGEGFYLSEIPDTTLAELAYHNAVGVDTIRYDFNA